MTLELEGYCVTMAANGQQALRCIAEHRPDVVLLELMLPVMNGWELQVQLRELRLDIPLVFMSADAGVRDEVERHHAAGYLAKPLDLEVLLGTVERFGPGWYT